MFREKHQLAIVLVILGTIAMSMGIYLTATHSMASSLVVIWWLGIGRQGILTGPTCITFAILLFILGYLVFREDKKVKAGEEEIEKEEQDELKKIEENE